MVIRFFTERMNVSRDTLNRLEKGDPSIAIGTYLRALRILGLDKDFDSVARVDDLGRKLQDAKLLVRSTRGVTKKPKARSTSPDATDE